jgi:steroid delta-isomerase-like uncharacterized protein
MNILEQYYDAFNRADMTTFADLLDEHIVHDINQGAREIGKHAFMTFMDRMNAHYKEEIVDLVTMLSDDGTRAAAEFTVVGTYLKTDSGLPAASGQTYKLPAGAFFEISKGKITRVTNYYNLQDWIEQVRSEK